MSCDGYLDGCDDRQVLGWAYDATRPDQPVEVEIQLDGRVVAVASADLFRPDLRQHRVGNGRHGFCCLLPPAIGAAGEGLVSARIKGTDFLLKGGPMRIKPAAALAVVAGDIVNNCNLRCPFCMVDYTNVHGLRLMTAETFHKALELLPLVPPGQFWLSCLHEPTLHPQFLERMSEVPADYRDRISFTTNLCKRLPDEALARMAAAGIYSIRVSFDSADAKLFAELRKGGKFEVFQDNLARLVGFLSTESRRPRLHFITMAFRDNAREIPDLVKRCFEEYRADTHEVRFLYYSPHLASWGREHLLGPDAWADLEGNLARSPYASRLTICGPLGGVREQFEVEPEKDEYLATREAPFGGAEDPALLPVIDPAEMGRQLPDEALRLRLRWDGVMMLEQVPEALYRVNLNKLERPAEYFQTMRRAAAQRKPGEFEPAPAEPATPSAQQRAGSL
jgi:hypothetical protein